MLPGLDYHPVEFGMKPRGEFVDSSEARAALQIWTLPENDDGPLPKKRARRAVTQAVAAEIARLLREAGADRIRVAGNPLRAGDIAVLVRSNAQGSEMKRALEALGVGSVEMSQSSVFQSSDAAGRRAGAYQRPGTHARSPAACRAGDRTDGLRRRRRRSHRPTMKPP